MKFSKGKIDEAVKDFLDEIEHYKDHVIIVEGFKDKKALRELGFKRIKTLRAPMYKVVEEVTETRVVVLTDLDAEGRKLYGKLKHEFSQRGVYIDDKLRNLLLKTDVRQIEGLTTYLKRFTHQGTPSQ